VCIEVEAKLKVDSLEEIEARLGELGGEFLSEQIQRDSYFDSSEGTLADSGKGFRVRQESSGDEQKVYLTYKGAKEESEFKRRQQIELEIEDGDLAVKLLSAIGFEKILVFEKRRRVWRFGKCEVGLDELPLLGEFVEIEGPDEKVIADVQSNLGLSGVEHIETSYLHLMKERLCKLGKNKGEVLF